MIQILETECNTCSVVDLLGHSVRSSVYMGNLVALDLIYLNPYNSKVHYDCFCFYHICNILGNKPDLILGGKDFLKRESSIKRFMWLLWEVFLTWILMKGTHFYFSSPVTCMYVLVFILINHRKIVTKGSTHLKALM